MALIPLEQEVELVKSYLAIEQVRFGKRLTISFCIETDANPLIPPLIVQPLVENAVKHGVYPKRAGGTIQISITKTERETLIVVSDDGVGMTPDKIQSLLNDKKAEEVGIGIQNINKRLQKYYGDGLNIQSNINQGTIITVRIPNQ
ncbi:Sensor histidine kinase YpdA [bioreactor metagenome]|uniref:Sensor histidine kinase YpdA n=1 Tax=bioreactor metagenome TaxID=1076179 RepID=A0A645GUA0_9ZZZZ